MPRKKQIVENHKKHHRYHDCKTVPELIEILILVEAEMSALSDAVAAQAAAITDLQARVAALPSSADVNAATTAINANTETLKTIAPAS